MDKVIIELEETSIFISGSNDFQNRLLYGAFVLGERKYPCARNRKWNYVAHMQNYLKREGMEFLYNSRSGFLFPAIRRNLTLLSVRTVLKCIPLGPRPFVGLNRRGIQLTNRTSQKEVGHDAAKVAKHCVGVGLNDQNVEGLQEVGRLGTLVDRRSAGGRRQDLDRQSPHNLLGATNGQSHSHEIQAGTNRDALAQHVCRLDAGCRLAQ